MPSRAAAYRVVLGDDIGDPDYLDFRFRDIDLRVTALEDVEKDWTKALATLTEVGLARIDEVLRPAYNEIRRLADLGAIFLAHSDTELLLETGLHRFTVRAEERDAYAPAGYVAAFVEGDTSKCLLGTVRTYDRASGVLEVMVEKAAGSGSATGWAIYPAAASDTADDRAAIDAMKEVINGYRAQCETFRLGAEADKDTAAAMRDSAVVANGQAQAAADFAGLARDDVKTGIAAWNAAVLGPLAVAPSLRPGGQPLQVGDQYFDTNPGVLQWKTWNGAQWTINAVPLGSEVGSVFGRTGSVEAQAGDYRGDLISRTAAQQSALAGASVEDALITLKGQVATEVAARTTAVAAKADKTITVTGGGLATGGGDLTAARTITVPEATTAQAQAGTDSTSAMTPRRTKEAILALAPSPAAASPTVAGVVQLATTAEGTAGTSATKVPSVAVAKSMIDERIAAVVNTAPAALDTLQELAAALGGDANFSATVTALIGTKLAASAVSPFMLTVLDDLDAAGARGTLGAAAAAHVHAIADVANLQAALDAKLAAGSYTPADILAKLLTVDGSGSGLDADKVRNTTPTTFGLARLSDADAASARLGLGLGSAATAAASAFQAAFFTTSGNDATFPGVVTAVDFNSTSDGRLKREVETVLPSMAATIVARLRPVTFRWRRGGDERRHYGLIAQEVLEVMPEAAGAMPDEELGQVLTVNYAALVPPLIALNQELMRKVEELTTRLARLEARV
ncbi:tail fiber domain-containing protein [Rhodoplanes sp. TEM]|uniref:Tail fiber domain-containing protein n=1 Tax=Rhodoplanes tepidamans TaxID=200616 RepID=A0ABT5J553_RHOTP|nr:MULTISPECIES: tail fiber domain-containing protein [Rhodoplanes]MDC7784764.1 tail fiber domain-containing protein [Rhodoplanes tepidamans]MDC7982231.1 tail fiber domain-containing protein [Rhodoplanes sp. TEM]MDQ0356238.1 hypothetical protein [Rhodoplanes tepidamans]